LDFIDRPRSRQVGLWHVTASLDFACFGVPYQKVASCSLANIWWSWDFRWLKRRLSGDCDRLVCTGRLVRRASYAIASLALDSAQSHT